MPSLFFINVDCSLTVIGSCLVFCVTMEKRLPCFCHILFIVFSIVTLTTGFCMLQKSTQHPFLVISDYFHKIFNEIWIKNTELSGQKDWKMLPRKYFTVFLLPFSFLISHVKSCRILYTSQITEAAVHRSSTKQSFWISRKIPRNTPMVKYYISKATSLYSTVLLK